jgi:hypothetical protein
MNLPPPQPCQAEFQKILNVEERMPRGDSSPPALHHRAKTTLSEDGVVTLQRTPFLRGESAG